MSKFILRAALAAAAFAAMVVPGVAADLAYKAPAPVVDPWNPWQIRVRALYVLPENGGQVNQVYGSDLSYSASWVPELDITYYFTKNIAAELILGVTPHNIYGEGALASYGQIAKVWLLPPTLTLQYHFTDFGPFKPYVGAGVNYTVFFNQDTKNPAFSQINVQDTWGLALQAGFDWMIDRHWGINFDVKKLFLQPSFQVNVAGSTTYLTGGADLDPWIFGTGITYRF